MLNFSGNPILVIYSFYNITMKVIFIIVISCNHRVTNLHLLLIGLYYNLYHTYIYYIIL